MNIYIARNSEQLGPFDIESLRIAISTLAVSLHDHAWTDGENDWLALKDLAEKKSWDLKPQTPPELSASTPPPPLSIVPPPPPALEDKWFVRRSGQEYGPYSKQNMRDFVKSGNLMLSDDVRHIESNDFSPLSSILGSQGVDFHAVAGKAADIVSEVGKQSAELANKVLKNAGPTGEKIQNKIRGKEKIVGGALVAAILLIAAAILFSGGPSAGDIKNALQRQVDDLGLSRAGVNMKITNVKKLDCKSADKGGYYCQYEVDAEATGPFQEAANVKHETNSARFVKDSKGWSAVMN